MANGFRATSLLWLALCACAQRPSHSPEESFEILAGAAQDGDVATVERLLDFTAVAQSVIRETHCGTQSYLDSIAGRTTAACGALPERMVTDSALKAAEVRLRAYWGMAASPRPLPDQELPGQELPGLWIDVEPVGYGTTQVRGDTAFVERLLRDPRLDTIFSQRYAMVPGDSAFWRVVGVRDSWRLVLRRQEWQRRRLVTVNDSAAAELLQVVDVTLRPAKIETGWDKYDFALTATLRNRGASEVRLLRPFAYAAPGGPFEEPAVVLLDTGTVALAPGDSLLRHVRYPFTSDALGEARMLGSRRTLRLMAERATIGSTDWTMYTSWRDFVRRGPVVEAPATSVPVDNVPPNRRLQSDGPVAVGRPARATVAWKGRPGRVSFVYLARS